MGRAAHASAAKPGHESPEWLRRCPTAPAALGKLRGWCVQRHEPTGECKMRVGMTLMMITTMLMTRTMMMMSTTKRMMMII